MATATSINATATATEQSVSKIFHDVKILRNMGSNDVLLNFNTPITSDNYFRLEANGSITNWPIFFHTLYYKTESGSSDFYVIGSSSNI